MTILDITRTLPHHVVLTPRQYHAVRGSIKAGYCVAHIRRWLLRQA